DQPTSVTSSSPSSRTRKPRSSACTPKSYGPAGLSDSPMPRRSNATMRQRRCSTSIGRSNTRCDIFQPCTSTTARPPVPRPQPPPSAVEVPKTIAVERVSGAERSFAADVCVVGSGAGGSVIAAELQRAGFDVLVLEQGEYRNEADFHQRELPAASELYLRGG